MKFYLFNIYKLKQFIKCVKSRVYHPLKSFQSSYKLLIALAAAHVDRTAPMNKCADRPTLNFKTYCRFEKISFNFAPLHKINSFEF